MSLKFIKTLTTDRAKRGIHIVELTIRQFKVELEWLESMLLGARILPELIQQPRQS